MARPKPAASLRPLSEHEMQTLQLVGQFKQLTTFHVKAMLFPDNASDTTMYRALQYLVDHKLLAATERLVASGRGGSGRYVYSLAPAGFHKLYEGDYARARASDTLHTLAIADCAVVLRELERAGRLIVNELVAEPDCHRSVGGYSLHPDLYVQLERGGVVRPFWFEVERSYKNPRRLDGKLQGYLGAYRYGDLDVFPQILWIAMYPETAGKVRRQIAALPEPARQPFLVTTLDNLPSVFV
jgi:hypothetical protein